MIEADALIIGGGGAGCAAALFLARRGVRCIVLERGAVGSQATGANYGGVRRQGRHPAELPLARRAHAFWLNIVAELGIDCGFRPTGHLKLARNAAEEAELHAYADTVRQHGLALHMLDPAALHAAFPWLGPDAVAGSFAPEDGAANPRLLTPALAQAARAAGAEIREHVPAGSFARDGRGFAVRAGGEDFTAPWLLNTAGYAGGAVAAAFGEDVPVAPLCPNMLVTEPTAPFLTPNLGVVGGEVYLRQVARGNLVIGGGRGRCDPDRLVCRPMPEATLAALRAATRLVPRLAGLHVIRSWSGIDGLTPDGLPVIGPSRIAPGLLHGFGFSGHGFMLLPAVGAVLAELVLDGHTDVPLDAFRADRFCEAIACP